MCLLKLTINIIIINETINFKNRKQKNKNKRNNNKYIIKNNFYIMNNSNIKENKEYIYLIDNNNNNSNDKVKFKRRIIRRRRRRKRRIRIRNRNNRINRKYNRKYNEVNNENNKNYTINIKSRINGINRSSEQVLKFIIMEQQKKIMKLKIYKFSHNRKVNLHHNEIENTGDTEDICKECDKLCDTCFYVCFYCDKKYLCDNCSPVCRLCNCYGIAFCNECFVVHRNICN